VAGKLIGAWGVLGVIALLGQAMWRLAPLAWEAIAGGLTHGQWVVTVVWVAAMAHAEGYRGFHRRFSPRVVARAQHLAADPRPLRAALAPVYCMSLFGASRRGMMVARGLFAGIVALVLLVRMVPQPWRGIVDAGVVVGLALGTLSILYYAGRALAGLQPTVPPDLPDDELTPR
jgi:hypothetical protein